VLGGEVTHRVEPAYPVRAAAAGVEGTVTVEVVISEEGKVLSARAVSGPPELHEAAEAAARQWIFTPSTVSGSAVKVSGTITFAFGKPAPPKQETRQPRPSKPKNRMRSCGN
jgi:protein TonB